MKRRNFLHGLYLLPALGLSSSILSAQSTQNTQVANTSGLDQIITIIQNDKRLNRNVNSSDIDIAIASVKRMNEILLEAIFETGVANDRNISIADTREINNYIFNNYQEEWRELHGDDENDGTATGFHKVVNDGARTKLFGRNAINRVADSIYHLGFETHLKNRLLNEDGNSNANYRRVSEWLNLLLKIDLQTGNLINPSIQEIVGETGTELDQAIEIIYQDEGLNRRISTGDMRIGANSANEMNKLIIEAISATDAGLSGEFTVDNIKAINQYLVNNYASLWQTLHGDDEAEEETGYHKVQNDGAKTKLFGKNAINRVLDGIYHLGFATTLKRHLVNEDGNKNRSFKRIALWLTQLLADTLSNQKSDLKILIPLYSYPNWYQADSYVWQKLIDTKKAYPDIEIVAIVNPNNGEFREENADYVRGIQDLISANITVVGYVYTEYGNRATETVVADIEAWSSIYKPLGVSGIFFDETSSDILLLDYYSKLCSEARAKGLEFTILNPGMTTEQNYIDSGIATVVVSYENPNASLLTTPPVIYNQPTAQTELSLLVYKMENDNVSDLIAFAREKKFSYIYFTEDGFDGNPWDSISSYFENQVIGALN